MIKQIQHIKEAYKYFPNIPIMHINGITGKLLFILKDNNITYISDTYDEIIHAAKQTNSAIPQFLLIQEDTQTQVFDISALPTHIPTEKPFSQLPKHTNAYTWKTQSIIEITHTYDQTNNSLANTIATMVNLTAKTPYLWPKTIEPYIINSDEFNYANPVAYLIYTSSFSRQQLYTIQSRKLDNIKIHTNSMQNCILCMPSDNDTPCLFIPHNDKWLKLTDNKDLTLIEEHQIWNIIKTKQIPPYRLMAMTKA